MTLTEKRYEELTRDELFEITRLRISVFVVEQNCPYQELDDRDPSAIHVWLSDENGIQAYLRVMDNGNGIAQIGRVISMKRRCGLGTQILREGIRVARQSLKAEKIVLEAQTYAKGLYEKQGFTQVSDEFLEDGIPHVKMELTFNN